MEDHLDTIMTHIIESIRRAGYEPYDQLTAYLLTWDERYITRNGNARQMIGRISRNELTSYIRNMRRNGVA